MRLSKLRGGFPSLSITCTVLVFGLNQTNFSLRSNCGVPYSESLTQFRCYLAVLDSKRCIHEFCSAASVRSILSSWPMFALSRLIFSMSWSLSPDQSLSGQKRSVQRLALSAFSENFDTIHLARYSKHCARFFLPIRKCSYIQPFNFGYTTVQLEVYHSGFTSVHETSC